MSLAHLHLLLNHFPTIGTIVCLGLFVFALIKNNEDLKRASFVIFILLAVATIPAYLSGKAAEAEITGLSGVGETFIQPHQNAALMAFLFMQLTGVAAWYALWQYRESSRPGLGSLAAVLILSLVTFGLMARTANIGGEIRHPEIGSSQAAPVTEGTEGEEIGTTEETGEPQGSEPESKDQP